MITYFLKTDSENSMWEILEEAGLAYKKLDMTDSDNVPPLDYSELESWEATGQYEWVFIYDNGNNELDIIGLIYEDTDQTTTGIGADGEPKEYTLSAPIEGYHFNVLVKNENSVLSELNISPSNPIRVFAGVN